MYDERCCAYSKLNVFLKECKPSIWCSPCPPNELHELKSDKHYVDCILGELNAMYTHKYEKCTHDLFLGIWTELFLTSANNARNFKTFESSYLLSGTDGATFLFTTISLTSLVKIKLKKKMVLQLRRIIFQFPLFCGFQAENIYAHFNCIASCA